MSNSHILRERRKSQNRFSRICNVIIGQLSLDTKALFPLFIIRRTIMECVCHACGIYATRERSSKKMKTLSLFSLSLSNKLHLILGVWKFRINFVALCCFEITYPSKAKRKTPFHVKKTKQN